MKNTRPFGIVAGLTLGLYEFISLFHTIFTFLRIRYPIGAFLRYNWGSLLTSVAFLLFALALLIDSSIMARIFKILGLVLTAAFSVRPLFVYSAPPMYKVAVALLIVIEGMLVLAVCLPGKIGQVFCYIPMVLAIVRQVAVLSYSRFTPFMLTAILLLMGYLFMGLYLSGKTKKTQPGYTPAPGYYNPQGYNNPMGYTPPAYTPVNNNPAGYTPVSNNSPSYTPVYSSPVNYTPVTNNPQTNKAPQAADISPAPAPQESDTDKDEVIAQLESLLEKGVLTQEEFEAKKARFRAAQADNQEKLSLLESLLEKGVLSQEEFDEKKKQILGN